MALFDDVCWGELAGLGKASDGDECLMLRERSVAGKSDPLPSCAVHGNLPDPPAGSYEPWPGANEAARQLHAFEAMYGDGSLCAHCGLYEDATCHRGGEK